MKTMKIHVAGRGPLVTHILEEDQKLEANVKEALSYTGGKVPELYTLTYDKQRVSPSALASEYEGRVVSYSTPARAAHP